MAVRRDGNGTWRFRKVVRRRDGTKVRISGTPTINTKVEAERAERDAILLALDPPSPKKEVLTFKKFVEDKWWPVYPKSAGNRPTTVSEKEDHLELHLKPALGNLLLDQVRGEAIDRFVAGLREKKLSPKRCKNICATLRRILASAVEWGYLDALPPLPKVKVPEAAFDFFTKEEAAQLLDAARTAEERLLMMFALHTGARSGEQLGLEWGDIDRRNNLVMFRRSLSGGVLGPTKSGRERKVPMTPSLRNALNAHRHLRGESVFCNEDGSHMTRWQLHERLWGSCRRAGLRKIRWQDLRHSFASQLVMESVPLPQVQQWLGHSTITMTMRYAHLAPNTGSKVISVLDTPRRGNNVATRQG